MFVTMINIFEQLLFTVTLYFMAPLHKKHVFLFSAARFIISFILISCINLISVSESILTILFILIDYIYLLSISYLSRGNALMYAILPTAVIAVTNTIIDITVMMFIFPGQPFDMILEKYEIPFDIIVQLIHAASFWFIIRYIRRNTFRIPEKEWFLEAALVGLCIAIAVCFQNVYLGYETGQYYLYLGIYCVALLIILMLILFKVQYTHIIQEEKKNLEVAILQNQMNSNEKILQAREELNHMRHDMKHFMKLLKNGQYSGPDSEEIRKTIASYEYLSNSPMPIQTTNHALNYILNLKQEEAFNNSISFICSMNLSSEIIMEDSDLYLLLSNLIDNAITHIGIEKKIRIIIRDVLDTIMIQVRNSVDGTVISKDGTFLYMDRSEEHGYGLTTIKLLTDKYDGEFIIEQDGQEAVCSVFIPQEQQAPQQE